MRLFLAALLIPALCAPVSAKKPRRAKVAHTRSIDKGRSIDKVRADRDRARREAEQAEVELAEVRSGHLTQPTEPERDFPTQQAEDSERPPTARR
jgi:hypothetical protein